MRNGKSRNSPWPVPGGHHRNSLPGTESRIVEKIADLFECEETALLGDIRDESAEDIRLIRASQPVYEPDVLMEQMFRMTDLETRANLNMNVLDSTRCRV